MTYVGLRLKLRLIYVVHATLASAFVIINFIDKDNRFISFNTKSGILTVNYNEEKKLYEMDFPSRKPIKTEIN